MRRVLGAVLGVYQPEIADVPEPVILPTGPLLTAAEVIGAIDMIIKAVDVIGDSESIDAARERLIESQMWIDRHKRTNT